MSAPHHFLILRGLAREQRHWGDFPATFAAAGDVHVHCLDLPGTGTEHRRDSPRSIGAIADDLRRRWLPLANAHPGTWGLLGVSLGGMVSMQWAAAYPDDFRHLIVINSSTRDLSNPLRRMQPAVIPRVAAAILEQDPFTRERNILEFTTCLRDDLDAIAHHWAGLAKERPMKRRNVLRQIAAAASFKAPEALRPRTLILAGANDALADPACALRLSRHLRAPLHIHPEAGHDLCTDAPEWVARQVRSFLLDSPTNQHHAAE